MNTYPSEFDEDPNYDLDDIITVGCVLGFPLARRTR